MAAFGPIVLAAGQKQAVVPSRGAKQTVRLTRFPDAYEGCRQTRGLGCVWAHCPCGQVAKKTNRGGPPDGWARHDPLLPGE